MGTGEAIAAAGGGAVAAVGRKMQEFHFPGESSAAAIAATAADHGTVLPDSSHMLFADCHLHDPCSMTISAHQCG